MPNEPLPTAGAMVEAFGLRPDMQIWIGGNNKEARREIEGIVIGMSRPPFGPLDAAIITPSTPEEAVYFAAKLTPRLTSDARVWIVTTNAANAASELASQVIEAGFAVRPEVSFRTGLRGVSFSIARTG